MKKANLTEVSELRLFLAAHSMNVAQIKCSCECPPLIPFLAEKTQSCLAQSRHYLILRNAENSVICYLSLLKVMNYIRGGLHFEYEPQGNTKEADAEKK